MQQATSPPAPRPAADAIARSFFLLRTILQLANATATINQAVISPLCHLRPAGNFLQNIMRRALPAESSGRFCIKRRDYSEFANDPCNRKQKPGHLQLLADLKANFTTVCSGFNVHQDYGFFQALGIDHSRTLTVVALRHPVERTLSHYYFQMSLMQDNRKNFLFWPKNDSDYSGLIAFGSRQRRQANYHTYMLAGAMGCRWPGGPAPPTSDAEILERAKRNLEKFCVILITVRIRWHSRRWHAGAKFGQVPIVSHPESSPEFAAGIHG